MSQPTEVNEEVDEFDTSGTWLEVESVSGEEFSDDEDVSRHPYNIDENIDPHHNIASYDHDSRRPFASYCASHENNIVSPNLPFKILSSNHQDTSSISFKDMTRMPSSTQSTPPRSRATTVSGNSNIKNFISPKIPFHVLTSSAPSIDVSIHDDVKAPTSFDSDANVSPTESTTNTSWASSDSLSSIDFPTTDSIVHEMKPSIDPLQKTLDLEESNRPDQRYLRYFLSLCFYTFVMIFIATSIYAAYIYYSAMIEKSQDTGLVIRDAVLGEGETVCTPFYSLISFIKLPDSISKSFYSMKRCAA